MKRLVLVVGFLCSTLIARAEEAGAQPHSAREALLYFTWKFSGKENQQGDVVFLSNGTVKKTWRAPMAWQWQEKDAQSFTLTNGTNPPKTIILYFDAGFTRFEGTGFDGTTKFTGIRGGPSGAAAAVAPVPPPSPEAHSKPGKTPAPSKGPATASVPDSKPPPAANDFSHGGGPGTIGYPPLGGKGIRYAKVILSPDARFFATTPLGQGFVSVFETATGNNLGHFNCLEQNLEFSPDDSALLVQRGAGEGTTSAVIMAYHVASGSTYHISGLEVRVAAFSPDGLLEVRFNDHHLPVLTQLGRAFDPGSHLSSLPLDHGNELLFTSSFCFSADGKTLAAIAIPDLTGATVPHTAHPRQFMIWKVATRERISSFSPGSPGELTQEYPNIHLTADGSILIAGYNNSWEGFTFFDTATGKELSHLEKRPHDRVAIRAISPTGGVLVGRLLFGYTAEESSRHEQAQNAAKFKKGAAPVPDLPRDILCAWSTATGKLLATLPGGDQALDGDHQMTFSPDGRVLTAICGAKGAVPNDQTPAFLGRWEMPSGSGGVSTPLRLKMNPHTGVCLSADGNHVAGSCSDGAIRIWDIGADSTRDLVKATEVQRPDRPASDYQKVPPGSKLVFRGTAVFFSDASGKLTPAPDGRYLYPVGSGNVMTVRGGVSYYITE